jgi:hypothetical protein
VEAINAGVGGTTIVDQSFFLRKSREVEVDMVVLTFTENDIDDLGKAEPAYVSLEKNRRLKSMALVSGFYRSVRRTALFNTALLIKARHGGSWVAATGEANNTVQNSDKLWDRYAELLLEVKEYLEKRSIELVFIIFPSHYRMGGSDSAAGSHAGVLERAESLGRRVGVRTVNLLGPMRASGLGAQGLYLLPYDGHPSQRGYRVASEAVFRELVDEVQRIAETKRNGFNGSPK